MIKSRLQAFPFRLQKHFGHRAISQAANSNLFLAQSIEQDTRQSCEHACFSVVSHYDKVHRLMLPIRPGRSSDEVDDYVLTRR